MTSQTVSSSPLIVRAVEILSAALVVLALLSIQALIGGTRLLFAFPAYGLIAIVGMLGLASLRSVKPKPDQICLWSATIFFGYVLVHATFSPLPYLARSDIYSILAGLVVYFVTCCVLTSAKARMSILACLLAAAIAHVLVGVIQFRSGNNFMPISFLQRFDYGKRASGFYICPNHLAGLLEVLGIFGLSIVCWSRWPVWSKLLIGYATAVAYLGVILSGSRGGYLSTAASLLVFAVITFAVLREGGSALLLRIGAAGALAAVIAIAAAAFLVRHSDFLNDRANNVLDYKNMRLDLWRAATEQWKQSPLLGTGSRTYFVYGRKYRTEQMQLDPIYTHNDYLQLLSEYGIVGTVTFLAFFLAHLRRGWIDAGRLGPKRVAISHRLASNTMALNAGALCALAAYAVHSVFDFNLHIPANVLLLAFVFGIVANPGVSYGISPGYLAPSLVSWRVVTFVLAALLGWQVWRLAPGEYFAEKARTAIRDYQFLSAVHFAQKGLAYESENPLLFYYLGRGRVMGGDSQQSVEASASYYEAAVPAFAKARELTPLDKTYVLELAFTYDALGRFTEAEGFYDEARALDPRSTSTNRYYQAHLERWKNGGLKPAPEPQIQ